MPALPHGEIVALSRIVDELDYYQLMNVAPSASARDVKRAYHQAARQLHPDANRDVGPELEPAVDRIAKRVAEAYAVLRNPRRRRAYDRQLEEGGGNRIYLGIADANARKQAEENEGATLQGRQYWTRARADIAREDWRAASRNLQTALTFEPANDSFKEKLAEVKRKL